MKKSVVVSTVLLLLAALGQPALAQHCDQLLPQPFPGSLILSDGFQALKAGDLPLALDKFGQVISVSPYSEEGGTANYTLGNLAYKSGNLDDAKDYYRKGFYSCAKVAAASGISLANLYWSQGRKAQAAEIFIRVKKRFPHTEQADVASLKAGMCYIGMARIDIPNRIALKKLALNFLADSENPEARIQELGIQWEMALDGHTPWKEVLVKLRSFEQDNPTAPASAKARAVLMLAEQAYIVDDYQRCLDEAQEVIDRFPEAKIEYYAALYTKAGGLQALGRDAEAITLLDKIIDECQDTWNYAGNDVRASSAYWKIKSLRKLGLEHDANVAVSHFRKTWPSETFYSPFLEDK